MDGGFPVARRVYFLTVRGMRAFLNYLTAVLTMGLGSHLIAADITIFGTDLFSEAIVERINESLMLEGHEVELQFEGSLAAREALDAGRAQAVLLALPDPSERFPASLSRYPVCSQIAALVVHESNPIRQLGIADIAGMFAMSGTLLNWGQLTDDPSWQDRKIALYKADSAAALAEELFSAMALNHEDTKASLRSTSADPVAIAAIVSDDPSAIVLVDSLSVGKPARYLAVAPEPGRQGYSPTPDNIFFGDYALRLPFELLVTPALPEPVLKSLLSALYSSAIDEALRSSGFIPIPNAERDSILGSLD